MAKAEFSSTEEFQTVVDRLFEQLSTDEQMGPRLADAKTPQRFEITDLNVVLNVRDAGAADRKKGQHLEWTWSDEAGWEPDVSMRLSSETFNKYFQGKLNPAIAAATGKVRTSGDFAKALRLAPIVKPAFDIYREMLEQEYEHLLV